MSATILYLNYRDDVTMHRRKLDGVRRFAKSQGWRVVPVPPAESRPSALRGLLTLFRPVGCIVDLSGADVDFPSGIFGNFPSVWLDLQEPFEKRPYSVTCDNAAVARTAFRELSATLPPSYAAIPHKFTRQWSDERVAAFTALCREAGKVCAVFPRRDGEADADRAARMADWAASLPAHCAVFGVNGPTAGEAAAAFAAAHRPMPRSLTLVGVDGFTPVEPGKPHPVTSSVMVDFELAGFLAAKMVAGRVRGSRDVPAAATFGPLLCIRRDSTRGFGRREPFVMAAAEMIRRKACDGLTASALAAHFDCSRNLFERRFREAMGRSVLDEIIHVRLEQVLLLLERPEVPIGAIASFCGFGSDIALIKLFKKRFGVSMRDWRKKHGH